MKELKTPLKAIRTHCLECSCGSSLEVKECVIKSCALYPYRLGKRPATVEKEAAKKAAAAGGAESA